MMSNNSGVQKQGGSSSSSMGPPNGEPKSEEVREQDRFLPIANISRIMKKSVPPNAKIAKDAKETVQECVSEFISFVTSEASEKCQKEKRKTINGKLKYIKAPIKKNHSYGHKNIYREPSFYAF